MHVAPHRPPSTAGSQAAAVEGDVPPVPPAASVASTWSVAVEPPAQITLREETFFGHGWQPLTIAFLGALWFLPPGAQFTVEELTAWLARLGWKSGNGQPIGVKAVRGELKLVRDAGYVRAHRIRATADVVDPATGEVRVRKGGLLGIRYEVSTRPGPAQSGIPIVPDDSVFPQVAPHVPNGGTWRGENAFPQVAPRVPNATTWRWGNEVDPAFPQVAPRVPNATIPPHTPPVGGTPTPLPPTSEVGTVSEGGGGRCPSGENQPPATRDPGIVAAEDWLQSLPSPWTLGEVSATKLAPLLARRIAEKSWTLDGDLFARLTENPPSPLKNRVNFLTFRVNDLPRRIAAAPASTDEIPGPRVPVDDACPQHPHRTVAECLPCRIDDEVIPPTDTAESPEEAAARRAITMERVRALQASAGAPSTTRTLQPPRRPSRAEREAEEARNRRAAELLLDPSAGS
ncbi:hypothetical protein [Embleya hyalina]|uniref:Uncharacterized protein n=1 Tax=Embleya hyalina TaxID=516124 RepID=A0A401Z3Z0_9ACTN|nr:hypothetical protein [Embleya hyalina]GCE01545.1 hypothetical protein EHYA_09311 [Embleya hyalina]